MNTREKFEQWWVRLALGRNTPDWYSHEGKAAAMAAWQARPEFTALCHSKTRQIGKSVGCLVENEAGGLAVVHNLGRVTWLDDCVAGPVDKAARAQDTTENSCTCEASKTLLEIHKITACISEVEGLDGTEQLTVSRVKQMAQYINQMNVSAQEGGEPVADFEIECDCGDIYRADSFGGGFIAGAGMCENCLTTHNSDHLASAVVPDWMHGISESIKTQNNRITADPLFVVFQKRAIVVDEDYDYDRISWGNSDGEADDEVQSQLNAYYDDVESDFWRSDEIEFFDVDTGIEVFRRCALKEVDEFVTACFTEVGANDYLMANGHNLNQPFIFVTSLYRNEEMKRLRGWLMQLPPKQEGE